VTIVADTIHDELRALSLSTSADVETSRTDRSGWTAEGSPRAVVRASSVDDVAAVLAWATAHGVPVVARGAGTGLAGGSAAGSGSIVLDLGGLDRIIEIDPINQLAIVEPGVITADLDRAAAVHGLRYAPDPGSVEISTIGGNIATNAGGLRGAKYGVTRDAVLGLDIVLADGTTLTTGRSTIKGVTGYDLASLFVGSEGTLGIIVRATVRLQPIPPHTATVSAYFPSLHVAAAAVTAVLAAGIQPSILELVDGPTLQAIDHAEGTDFRARGASFVLLQTDGFGASAESDAAVAVLERFAARIERTEDPDEAEQLTRARRLALPSLEALGPVLIEDITVPRSRFGEAIERIDAISAVHSVRIFVFGHAADGNLHPIILVEDEAATARAAADLFALALELGGTLTGEHGIGALKRDWLLQEIGPASHALQQEIKKLLDPAGILNPGKAI
jgi:glycolate oxidase